jgi:tRNA (guanine10-N2)-dimethyltransferase
VYGVLLQGDHPTLPHAELAALQAVHGSQAKPLSTERVQLVPDAGPLEHMVHAAAWGEQWHTAECSDAGITEAAAAVLARTDGQGSGAVVVRRFGHKKSNLGPVAARTIGGALADAGHAIDLTLPDTRIYAWLGEGKLFVGKLMGEPAGAFESRISNRRAHFSPVSMHPRRAAGLVHLARAPAGGRILDPFCGTGGIVMESARMGFDTWASDLDAQMVQGTMQTLTDVAETPLDATAFQADIGDVPSMVGGIEGICTDLPYGGASSTHDEAIGQLYERAMQVFAEVLPRGGRAVVGHAKPSLLSRAAQYGLIEREHHEEFVHRSLTRHYSVFERQ